jgi:flagellin-like protein
MHRRGARSRGLAEIVGTLMLVLIVVAAATAFSFFVATYQQQLQSQENASHQRALEVVHVLSVQTAAVGLGNDTFAGLSFTISSGDVNPIQLTDLVVNGNVAWSYNATWESNGSRTTVGVLAGDASTWLDVPSLGQVLISLDLNPKSPLLSFPSWTLIPTSGSYLTLYLQTQRGSGFTFVYVPPTALAVLTFVQTWNGATLVENPVLDGTHSFQEGANATIVAWDWSISGPTFTTSPWSTSGAQVELSNLTAGDAYYANLTVYNSIGLFGTAPMYEFQG